MQALLDTHTFLWWNADDAKLSNNARELISNPNNSFFLSVVSAWEIIIKAQLGKLPLPEAPDLYISSRANYYSFQILSVEMKHVLQIWKLNNYHNDPFDRLLIAQSQVERLPIITADSKFSLYDITVIW
jgi:PIN domain nuclease of toxin-antitoxin system